jgi:hypothetical protein
MLVRDRFVLLALVVVVALMPAVMMIVAGVMIVIVLAEQHRPGERIGRMVVTDAVSDNVDKLHGGLVRQHEADGHAERDGNSAKPAMARQTQRHSVPGTAE